MLEYNSLGNKISQSEEGLQSFWNWFGNSQCIDSEGRPLVMYHGSYSDFDTFQLPHEREGEEDYSEGYSGGNLGQGHYFTPDEKYAKRFGNTKSYYLKINNYLDCTSPDIIKEINNRFNEYGDDLTYGVYGEIIDEMMEEGNYDGAYGESVGGLSYGAQEWTIIMSKQAKLITNNAYSDSDKVHEDSIFTEQLSICLKLAGLSKL
jgi:hypothetical protein